MKFITSLFIFKCKCFTSEHLITNFPLHYSNESGHSSREQSLELYAASFIQL
jgi:hypothetical protein